MSDKKVYLAKAGLNGKFNGQIATASGPQTLPNKQQAGLDKAQIGSQAGILKK